MEINEKKECVWPCFLKIGNITTKKYGKFNSIDWLNGEIKKYIEEVYGPFGFKYGVNEDLNIEGQIINSEYISKMVNNYTIFKNIIELNGLKIEDEFYNYMLLNLREIYNINGKYFKKVTLPILINASRKGNIGEKLSKEFFINELSKKGINIVINSPTVEEDISGIDGKFNWNGKSITIQIKPYNKEVVLGDGKVEVFSPGSLSLSTDYLVLYKNGEYIIIRGKDVKIEGNHFTFQEDKIVAKK